ncbi:MAG: SDR family oxidoreductase [Opitutae bacterium]|nr:SDR family oxidoreductase [Opitutae bacterium]
MNLKMKGQGAVVVGGASGIGKAITECFEAEGCRVCVIDLVEPVGANARQADVRDFSALKESVDEISKYIGRIDHAVFAAGMGSGKFGYPFWNLDPGDWEDTLRVNLLGAVNFAHAFTPYLREQEEGSMLFIASVAGQIGSQTDPPYSAAKAGVINFMQCVAKDLAPYKIRANALSPGMVRTPINQSVWQALQEQIPENERQEYDVWANEKIQSIAPLGRWQTPEECAAVAVFLASSMGRNITGQTINVDGGQVMHA